MKKLIYSATLMVLAFFAASCQQENLEPVAGGETVSYKVQVPDALATKASGDGFTVYYQVYRDADLKNGDFLYDGSKEFSGGSATLDLKFVRNQNFTVLFWAQKTTGVTAYDIDDLRDVKLATLTTNDANAEVFVGTDNVEDCVSIKKGIVELKRPVAQLNIATLTSGLVLGETSNAHQVDPSKVKVTLHGLYTSYNVATGDVQTSANVEFSEANSIKNEFITGYTHLVQNFIGFIPKDGDNIDVDFTINAGEDGYIEHSVSNVPVKPNYRTNIIGNLVSGTAGYSITIDEAWTTPDNTVEVVTVSNAADLQNAIDNIEDGTEGNIKLEGDIDLGALFAASTQAVTKAGGATLPIEISAEKAMTLDLNGFTITTPWEDETAAKHYYAFDNKGTLKIVDSKANGKIVARGIFNYGIMTLESGSIEACDGNGGYGVRNYQGAKFVMNGGTVATIYEDGDIPGEGYDACPIRVDQGAKAEIKGGIINNVSNFTVAIDNYGETIVDGGTFTSVHTTLANSAVMTINGGSFTCNGLEGITAHALWAAEGTTTINGGTFNGKDNYNGFNVDASTGATVYIKGGEFLPVHSGSLYGDGTIIVTGGTFFDQVPEKYLAAGYSCQQNEEGKWIVPQVALANIGDVSYPTLDAAIEAVPENIPTIITVQAAVFTDESIVIPAGKSITLDLNGKTLTAAGKDGYAITNMGELTIKNNGVINGVVYAEGTAAKTIINGGTYNALENAKYVLLNSQGASLEINAATINGGSSYPIYSYDANSKLVINDATVNATFGCVNAYGNGGKVEINGGTFQMTGVQGKTSHIAYFSQNCTAIINGGTFEKIGNISMSAAGGGGICVNGGAELTINGGSFAGDYDDVYNYGGSIIVKGGTYKFKPDFLANGYAAEQNEEGRWIIVSTPVAVEDGYEISTAAQLRYFAESINSGETTYNTNIKLTADIDLNNEEWIPIGSITQEHGFCGNFDGNGYTIKNLKITNVQAEPDQDGNVYAGFFGITENNTIKNLVIENVDINLKGHIVAAAIAYPYYTDVENVTVKGDINIVGGNYTSGVLAYTRRCVNAKNLTIEANSGSSIEGAQTIGGVISDIQMNGGLTANYSNFKATGLTIKGTNNVGGISGIISEQTLDGATVENVIIDCDDVRKGSVSGALGGKSIIKNISVTNVVGADNYVGATYDNGGDVVVNGDEFSAMNEF